MKALIPSHKGYKFIGVATIELWSGIQEEARMEPFFLPRGMVSHTVIKRSVNSGGHDCKRVMSARVRIYDKYPGYTQYNRTIVLNEQQCQEACIVVN